MSSFSTLMKAVRPVICEAYTQGKYNYGTAAEGPIPRLRKMEILPNSLVGLWTSEYSWILVWIIGKFIMGTFKIPLKT